MTSPRRGGRPRVRAFVVPAVLACSLVLAATSSTSPPEATSAAIQAQARAATPASAVGTLNGKHVIAISVDGLNPSALTKLGRSRTPYLHKLIYDQGAGTTNARTQIEMTLTLPNHTSMVTGRRITASAGGHGVTWNTDTVKKTVQQAAGHDVASVFQLVHWAGGRTGVFATKGKFWLFERSWPMSVDKNVIKVEQDAAVTKALRADLITVRRSLYFLHLGLPDQQGHAHGWMSRPYLDAVEEVDRLVGSVMRRIRLDAALNKSAVVILTADHGGIPGTKGHSATTDWRDYRVPFAFWGAGVDNTPLYALNPTRAWPDLTQPGFTASPQPIRNGELANASLDVLGLGPVPGSRWNDDQDLAWHD